MATYLVTGVAGFIGSRVAEMLLADGHHLVGLDNLNDYYDVALKKHRLERISNLGGFEFHQIDIESAESVEGLFAKHSIDAVFNLAARAGVRQSMLEPHLYMSTNAMGTLNLLESMRKHSVEKLVLASTSSLYAGLPMPFKESLPVNTPISPYAASKKAAEMIAYSYHHLYKLDVSVVRYFTVFGPIGRPDMAVMRFIKWISEGTPIELFGDGSQSRDFTYVDDIASGTIAALRRVGFEIFNLGGGNNPISMKQIITWIEEDLGKSSILDIKPFHKADMLSTWADISKASEILSWSPGTSPREGIRKCVEYYLANKNFFAKVTL